jgi:hypothetical protein
MVIHVEKSSPGRYANSAANPLPTSRIPLSAVPSNCCQNYDIARIFVADRTILRRKPEFSPDGSGIEPRSRRRI